MLAALAAACSRSRSAASPRRPATSAAVNRIEGTLELPDGTREPLDADALVAPAEWACVR